MNSSDRTRAAASHQGCRPARPGAGRSPAPPTSTSGTGIDVPCSQCAHSGARPTRALASSSDAVSVRTCRTDSAVCTAITTVSNNGPAIRSLGWRSRRRDPRLRATGTATPRAGDPGLPWVTQTSAPGAGPSLQPGPSGGPQGARISLSDITPASAGRACRGQRHSGENRSHPPWPT
jgi:hypothetical protein